MAIAIGCDDAALELKAILTAHLEAQGIAVTDYGLKDGEQTLYPDVAARVACAIKEGKHERGILLCGTGLGMAMMANKVPGIRAATCHDPFSAERARKSNNAQIITMGARVIGPELAKSVLDTWLRAEFVDGPSTPKVNRINEIESELATRYLR